MFGRLDTGNRSPLVRRATDSVFPAMGPSRHEPSTAPAQDFSLDELVGYLLRKAHQRHRSLFSKGIGERLAPTQFGALVSLHVNGPTSQNELGRRTAMDSATITGVVDRLVQRGLVSTKSSPDDERLSVVDLTPTGRELVAELIPRAMQINTETLAPLTAREADTLRRLLAKIANA